MTLCATVPGLSNAAAEQVQPSEVFIFYGGLLPMNATAQPHLANLLRRATSDAPLEVNPMRDAWQRAGTLRLKPTAHPIVTTDERMDLAVGKLFGLSPSEVDGEALRAKLDDLNNLALTLVASFEYTVAIPADIKDGTGVRYLPHHIVGVTAVLSRLGTGRIVASSSAVTELTGPWGRSAKVSDGAARPYFAKAYSKAAVHALARLEKQLETFDGSFPEMDMVTFPIVADRKWQETHGVKTVNLRQHGNVCKMPFLCDPGDGQCQRATSLIASLATASLSNSGIPTLPPGLWSHWNLGARDTMETTFGLKVDLAGGEGVLDGSLQLVFKPAQAARKVVVLLAGVVPDDRAHKKSKRIIHRTYRPKLHVLAFPECGLAGVSRLSHKDYVFDGYPEQLPKHLAQEPPTGPFWEAVSLISLFHAFEGLRIKK